MPVAPVRTPAPHRGDRRIRAARAVTALVALVATACLGGAAATPSAPATRVATEGGVVEGTTEPGGGVIAFHGIPYAAPPVGALRWRPPEPAPSWSGVRRADRLARNCMQTQPYGDIDPYAAGVSEDCLYLNVWTAAGADARRPVMVWIHGGGFRAGFGGEARHDGGPLARKGVIVVTLNYRLGAFGFLAHPALAAEASHGASGNYGLLDQIAALQWVRRNIARFGGDPSRVTIFGESAGGMSVGALVASPLAAGLFHRAILQSGTGLGAGVVRRDSAEAQGARVAARLGVVGGGDVAARLRAVGADSLLAAVEARPTMGFRPALDGRVLPRPVDSAIAAGAANVVPVIVGSNADEGDAPFGAPARAFARLVAARGAPAYLYLFTRVGEDSANRRRGAYHSAEITFAFGRPRPILESAGRTAYDSTLAEAMTDYWAAFAAHGDPNAAPAAGRRPHWPAYDATIDAYLELGPTIGARQGIGRATYDSLDRAARARGEIRP